MDQNKDEPRKYAMYYRQLQLLGNREFQLKDLLAPSVIEFKCCCSLRLLSSKDYRLPDGEVIRFQFGLIIYSYQESPHPSPTATSLAIRELVQVRSQACDSHYTNSYAHADHVRRAPDHWRSMWNARPHTHSGKCNMSSIWFLTIFTMDSGSSSQGELIFRRN